ncbi:MAG TPA: class I SAM-dependent methyltransferase [Blastocatellia bacterium]|nr:class I SAM-dependent methyltransferase [Blastocatellia bacterium]
MSQSLTQVSDNPLPPEAVSRRDLYADRRLAEGYPGLDRLALKNFTATLDAQPDDSTRLDRLLGRLNRLIDLERARNIVVLGCGPRPQTVKHLLERRFNAIGVEPVPLFVEAAREYLNDTVHVMEGAAERIPVADGSQQIVFCDSVLEHVVSPTRSLDEMHRVLAPGGIAFITTTNRYRFSITGDNGEFMFRFFNWLPALLKESLVHHHLHYDPRLANYSQLPAVHWFSYAELCRLGREAGFAQFYSLLDLIDTSDPGVSGSRLKRWLADRLKFNPWLRTLALTQRGDTIIMLKR